jgi:hypothetical protein
MFLSHILSAFLQGDVESLLAAGIASALQHAKDALDDALNPVKKVEQTLKDFANNLIDGLGYDPEQVKEVVDRVNKVVDAVKSETATVVQDIANDVNSALGTGQIPYEGDAGLGQTHDNFTPGGDQFSVGQTPGIDIGGVGLNRTGDGGGGGNGNVGYGGDSGSGSSGSSSTPLGVSGSGAGTSSGEGSSSSGGSSSSTGVTPPTASDLGLDPNSGAYIEYQPSEGQVQITYPDGTTETRPWPPQ